MFFFCIHERLPFYFFLPREAGKGKLTGVFYCIHIYEEAKVDCLNSKSIYRTTLFTVHLESLIIDQLFCVFKINSGI